MPRLCCLLLSLLIASSASGVTMDWTYIGNPGNAADANNLSVYAAHCGSSSTEPCGAVPYGYHIGTYEVTNAQYAEFLNAKAGSVDPFQLYNPRMADPSLTPCCFTADGRGGIVRSGTSGNFTYSAIAGRENMPVNHVSVFDAMRFANWMNNGQGSGDTETGAYTLLGGTVTPSNFNTVGRNVGATIAITNNSEWHKAAYYDPATAGYFHYPTGTNTTPTCSSPTATPNSANCNRPDDDLVPVGSYTGSASPYGTFDQAGNVYEWSELRDTSSFAWRFFLGGSFRTTALPGPLRSDLYGSGTGSSEFQEFGFRLVMIPEPGTGLLVIAGLLGFAGWRRVGA